MNKPDSMSIVIVTFEFFEDCLPHSDLIIYDFIEVKILQLK